MKYQVPDKKSLAKKYAGLSYNATIRAEDFKDRLRIPSRSIWLNNQIGGGIPYGTIMEIIGYESTGKTLLAKDFGVVTQMMDGIVLWADSERAFDFVWAEQNGLDLDKVEIFNSNEIEPLGDWMRDQAIYWRSQLVNNEPILLVVDSIAALETVVNIESDMSGEKAQMGNRAKAIYNLYRKRNMLFSELGITVIMINQVRKKMNASLWESAETTPGGEATKFYASIRLMIHAYKQIKGRMSNGKFLEDKDKGFKMGRVVAVEVLKNKTAPPKDRAKVEVYFTDHRYGYVGYNRYAFLRELLLADGIVELRGSRYYYKDKMICNGEKNFIPMMHDNPKLRRNLIRKLGIATPTTLQNRLEDLKKNLYPVKAKNKKNAEGEEDEE